MVRNDRLRLDENAGLSQTFLLHQHDSTVPYSLSQMFYRNLGATYDGQYVTNQAREEEKKRRKKRRSLLIKNKCLFYRTKSFDISASKQ